MVLRSARGVVHSTEIGGFTMTPFQWAVLDALVFLLNAVARGDSAHRDSAPSFHPCECGACLLIARLNREAS